jgi:hypothetical protein
MSAAVNKTDTCGIAIMYFLYTFCNKPTESFNHNKKKEQNKE